MRAGKRAVSLLLAAAIWVGVGFCVPVRAANSPQSSDVGVPVEIPARSAILVEQCTGRVLC